MKAADESGQSTLQTHDGLVGNSKYPDFPVDFARLRENLEIAARPFSCPPSISAVESERHRARCRANPAPIREGLANLILIQTTTRI